MRLCSRQSSTLSNMASFSLLLPAIISSDNAIAPLYPANIQSNNVVSVAATDWNDNLATFSDYGAKTVSIAAPGKYIYSTYPTNLDASNPYRFYSGTSQAAPEVTGALALVWSIHPDWSYSQVINAVLSNTDAVAGLNGKVQTGRLDIYKSARQFHARSFDRFRSRLEREQHDQLKPRAHDIFPVQSTLPH